MGVRHHGGRPDRLAALLLHCQPNGCISCDFRHTLNSGTVAPLAALAPEGDGACRRWKRTWCSEPTSATQSIHDLRVVALVWHVRNRRPSVGGVDGSGDPATTAETRPQRWTADDRDLPTTVRSRVSGGAIMSMTNGWHRYEPALVRAALMIAGDNEGLRSAC